MHDHKPLLIFAICASLKDGMKACRIVRRGHTKYQLLENADSHVVCLGTYILVIIRAKATISGKVNWPVLVLYIYSPRITINRGG